MWELWLEHNQVQLLALTANSSWFPSVSHGVNVHWPDMVNDWVDVLPYLDQVLSLPPSSYLLPTERNQDWAFADAMSGAVSVKTANYTLYMSLLWRGKPGARLDPAVPRPAGMASNLTKADFRGRYFGQLLDIPTETADGLWSLQFADLAVVMNNNLRSVVDGQRTWELPAELHGRAAIELVSGRRTAALPAQMVLEPLDALVFRLG
jgi:hypothetical protein